MNEQSRFQELLLKCILAIIYGDIVMSCFMAWLGKPVDPALQTCMNNVLSGLIGALGGHAIGTSQKTQTGDIVNPEVATK
jgi:hypothetical protein